MALQQITVTLTEKIYRQMQKRSEQMHRSVEEEVAAVIVASVPEDEQLPPDTEQELAQLDLFTDDELWRAARLIVADDKTNRMQFLVEKQQLEGLTDIEKQETKILSQFFNRIMLVRAKAAVLLKERGHDINSLLES